ncbi:MAG: flagellar basal body-associated FliL family protein [bacterium]|nr:flagellar basal body-associated FliL family protein [bacterium]
MADEEIEESGGGGKKKLVLILVVVLLLLAGVGVGAFMFLGGTPEDEAVPQGAGAPQSKLEEEIAASSASEVVKLTNPVFTPPRKYTVNLRDGKHFLSIKLVAALEDPMALGFLASREYLIDDMVISFLQNLTTEDLRTRAGTELVKRELYKKVNSIFTQEFVESSETKDRTPVKKILITEFILN